jgi:hypothetical protein
VEKMMQGMPRLNEISVTISVLKDFPDQIHAMPIPAQTKMGAMTAAISASTGESLKGSCTLRRITAPR